MSEFEIKITKSFQKKIKICAKSKGEALMIAWQMYLEKKILLEQEDFTTEIDVVTEQGELFNE